MAVGEEDSTMHWCENANQEGAYWWQKHCLQWEIDWSASQIPREKKTNVLSSNQHLTTEKKKCLEQRALYCQLRDIDDIQHCLCHFNVSIPWITILNWWWRFVGSTIGTTINTYLHNILICIIMKFIMRMAYHDIANGSEMDYHSKSCTFV